MLAHRPPEGWAGAAAWREEVERVVRDQVRPAIGRYADLLAELLPRSRPPEQAGLLYVPGGVPAYASCVRNGTTLPFDPDELHRLGLAALADIEEQIGELGRRALGTGDVDEIMVRFRKDPALTAPDGAAAMARAAAAIARAAGAAAGHVPLTAAAAVRRRAHATAHGQSSARRRTTRRRPGTAPAPARTCSTTCSPGRPEAGPWRPRPFTKGCPDTTRSSPGCSSCRTCRCC